MNISKIIKNMVDYSNGNRHNINHFMKVYAYAKVIGECEGLANASVGEGIQQISVKSLCKPVRIA